MGAAHLIETSYAGWFRYGEGVGFRETVGRKTFLRVGYFQINHMVSVVRKKVNAAGLLDVGLSHRFYMIDTLILGVCYAPGG